MRTITMYLVGLVTLLMIQNLSAQEGYEKKVGILKEQKAEITVCFLTDGEESSNPKEIKSR